MAPIRIVALTSYGAHTALTGGRLRRDSLLAALADRGHDVRRFDVRGRPGPSSAARSIPTVRRRPFRETLAGSDVVLLGDVFCLPTVPLLRRTGTPIVLDLVDSPYRLVGSAPRRTLRERASAAVAEAQLLPVMQGLYPLVDLVTYISAEDVASDAERVRRAPEARVVPNGIAASLFAEDLAPPPDDGYLAWLADWTYAPNRDSLRWFVEDVAPRLSDHALARVRLFGAGDPWTVGADGRAVDRARRLVAFAGFVESLPDVYAGARAVIAPVVRGAGINNKVLEPLAAGRALVTTGVGTRGLPAEMLRFVRHTDDGADFAAGLRSVLSAPWVPAEARAARASVHALSWGRSAELMEQALATVVAAGTTERKPSHDPI